MLLGKNKLFYIKIVSVLILILNMFTGIIVSAENKQDTYESAKEVLKYIENEKPKISSDGKSIVLPESPDPNYEVSLYGSDNKQIIDMDLNYYQLFSDMNVNVLYKVTNNKDKTDDVVSTDDIHVKIKGQYENEEGDNSVPNVMPGLREWKGLQGEFSLLDDSNIVVDNSNADKLMETANNIQGYIEEMVGKKLDIKEGSEA